MSYQRSPHPLSRFYSISEYYVWSDGKKINDYSASYSHNPSFCQLIGDIVASETNDPDYAAKITRILATKLGCAEKLRNNGYRDEYNGISHFDEDRTYMKILHDYPIVFELSIILSDFDDMIEKESDYAEEMILIALSNLHIGGNRWSE